MREILFRGKRLDNGEWAEGYYVKTVDYRTDSAVHLIIELPSAFYPRGEIAREYEINSSTIGQYTGLTDKNGKKIFEGDIIHLEYSQVFFGGEYFGEYTAEVSYKGDCFITDGINNGDEIETPLSGFDNDEVEIIGNIHDNPELLEEKE